MSRLAGKVAIVTGASRGIGAAIAKRLAADGAKVVVNYSSNLEAADRVVSQIQAADGEAAAVQADVSDLAQIQQLFAQTVEKYGRLDILVNNAGLAEYRPIDKIDEEFYTRLFNVNVRGVLFATQAAVLSFGKSGGRIVNISSGVTKSTPPATSIYTATKAAVEAMTQCFAAELGARNITVNAVAPGLVDTDMLAAAVAPEIREALVASTPLGRLGQPEDIADVVAFLVSDDARWVTGQIVGANGGMR